MIKHLDELKETLGREIEKIAKAGDISVNSLEKVHMMTDTYKNLCKIYMLEEEAEGGGYSRENSYEGGSSGARRGGGGGRGRGSSRGGSSYEGGESYDDDASYVRRRRDRMGRYSSEGGYSQDGDKDHMMHKLGEMMEDADPKEREALKECMRAIERM